MFTFLLILLILDSVLLIAAILLQSGKGQGLSASFGGASSSADALIGTRQAGNVLTQASWWCGGIFLGLAFVLSLMSARRDVGPGVLGGQFGNGGAAAPAAPAAPTPNAAAPAVPLTPAPAAPTTPAAPAQKTPAKP